MALQFNQGNPDETMQMSLRGLKDYYASIDDPERRAEEIRKGYNNTLSSASSMQNTSNRLGAKTGAAKTMASYAGDRSNSYGQVEGQDAVQQIKLQQQKDAISARIKAIAMANQLAGQQGSMATENANYAQNLKENAAKGLLADNRYLQTLQDIARKEAKQRQLLELDNSFQPSGWDRAIGAAVGGTAGLGGYALSNYWSSPDTYASGLDWIPEEQQYTYDPETGKLVLY